MSLFLFIASVLCFAHAHMSMNFPVPRTRGRVSKTDCTSAERSQAYLTWEWNEPMNPARPCLCHGTFKDANIRPENVITAGSTITISLAGTAYHGGGHCAFWWSTDGITWKKFLDYLDCTKQAVVDKTPINVVIPKTIDAACGTRCILAWTWIPRQSGSCEIYMTCADVQITGTTGGGNPHSMSFNPKSTTQCVRVNAAGWSTSFGPVNTNGMGGTTTGGGGGTSTGGTSPAITARPTPTTTSGSGSNAPPGALCTNPQAQQQTRFWGPINTTTGACGPMRGRCDSGMCCSEHGFCGPELKGYTATGVPEYFYYSGNGPPGVYSSAKQAFGAYCNTNSLADFRQVPCCAISYGQYNPSHVCLQNYTLLTNSVGAMGMWMSVVIGFAALLV